MSWWPGWNSVESAGWWSNFYFWFGIVALFLLVITEVLAHRYSLRKDELLSIAESETQSAHNAEVAALSQQIADAKTARSLTEDQKVKLFEFLKSMPAGKLVIKASASAFDARAYGDGIAAFLRDRVGWDVRVDNALILGPNIGGVWFTIRDPHNIPVDAKKVINAFVYAAIPLRATGNEYDAKVPDGEVWLQIGPKL
jgi:hypothetical protein